MHGRFMAFRKSRRSAVAMIFALSFLPLIYLVGLSVDYTFYSLAASQAQLAAQGAATNAVRAAISTYTLEIAGGVTASGPATPNAYADGVSAGEQAGYMWYIAQLGELPRGSVSATGTSTSGSTSTVSGYPIVTVGEPAAGGGFVAKVSYNLTYPPLFNGLFKRTTNWVATGNTQAASNFDFAEILFMLDTSNSMLIGTDVNDINTMQYNSVCQGPSVFDSTIWTGQGLLTNGQYDAVAADGDVVTFSNVTNYTPGGSNGTAGSCNSKSVTPPANPNNSSQQGPMIVCALACHSSSTPSSVEAYSGDTAVYPEDLYGEARRLRNAELNGGTTYTPYLNGPTGLNNASPYGNNAALTLRLDIVMDSANTAIADMISEEGFVGQFTAGVYQFNKDVSAIAMGSASTPTPEATDLTTAQTMVEADDYLYKAETTFPPVYNSGTRNTDFATSMQHLRDGTVTGTAISPVNSVTGGQTNSTPLKFLFIITDGLDDPPCSYCDKFGEMTSYNDEAAGNSSAVCYPFKALGFTIYVLAIQYYPLSSINYYNALDPATSYTVDDYSSKFSTSSTTSVQDLTTTTLTSGLSSPSNPSNLPPTQIGLEGCASTTNDFFTATGASSISNAINTMLRSALASTIRLSN